MAVIALCLIYILRNAVYDAFEKNTWKYAVEAHAMKGSWKETEKEADRIDRREDCIEQNPRNVIYGILTTDFIYGILATDVIYGILTTDFIYGILATDVIYVIYGI